MCAANATKHWIWYSHRSRRHWFCHFSMWSHRTCDAQWRTSTNKSKKTHYSCSIACYCTHRNWWPPTVTVYSPVSSTWYQNWDSNRNLSERWPSIWAVKWQVSIGEAKCWIVCWAFWKRSSRNGEMFKFNGNKRMRASRSMRKYGWTNINLGNKHTQELFFPTVSIRRNTYRCGHFK